jgi:formate hydrogenlyase transcriptional activator
MDGFQVCRRLKEGQKTSDIPVIFISALDEVVDKVKGFAAGGVDYITKPFQSEELLARVETHLDLKRTKEALQQAHDELDEKVKERTADLAKAKEELQARLLEIEVLKERLENENIYLRQDLQLASNFGEIIGESDALKYVFSRVSQVAPTDSAVLILGETGTGKGLIARAIHQLSGRKERPLVNVDCAALPPNLIESELFGREKGAFTGAATRQIGRFELADGGTIVLDEIAELPLELQAKLLRAIQDREFERLGSPHTIKVDVRIVASTRRDLKEEVLKGRFREDLYYRLHVFPITIPPLRQRVEDIPLLVNHFVSKFVRKMKKDIKTIPKQTLVALEAYSWPGNVRELEHVIERAVIVTQGPKLQLAEKLEPPDFVEPKEQSIDGMNEVERLHILKILEKTNWKIEGKQGAANLLGLKPSTLRNRMAKLGIARLRDYPSNP